MQAAKAPERAKRRIEAVGERAIKRIYPCDKYEVYLEGDKLRELWVTDWSNLEGGGEVAATFEQMSDFFSQMVASIARFGQGKAPLEDLAFEHLGELGGFPVVIREFNPATGALEVEMTLHSARTGTMSSDQFKLPTDYSQREIFAASR